jgi:dTDP-4-dehydrorhamnose reductase
MLRLAGERDEIRVVADQFGTPTAATDIATTLIAIVRAVSYASNADEKAIWGTYHYTALGETSWHGFAAHIFAYLERTGRRRPRLKPISTADYPTPARRPANSRLDCSRIEQTFGIVRVRWETSLDCVLGEILSCDADRRIHDRSTAP